MKISKYIIGLSFMVVGLLTSCNQDNVGAIYTPTSQNVSFESDEPSQVLANSSSVDVPVRITRSLTDGSYTAHYTISGNEDGIFNDANGGQVTFEDGQAVAVINLKAQNMDGGEEYKVTLNLSDADVATADKNLNNSNAKTVISVKCDYVWEDFGTGGWESTLFGDEWDQPLMKAKGFNVYKVLDLYDEGVDLIVKVNSDNTVEVKYQYVYNYDQYGKLYAIGNYDGTYSGFAGYYYPDYNAILMQLCFTLPKIEVELGTIPEVLYLP